ncbi:MAG TPA: tripartite tricarboxylate transporter substrate binding protein [Burkholderiales bacterium]|nr:tripartite tricarboxylate transporter substrate binding protein [Burkholderiales bacterium]
MMRARIVIAALAATSMATVAAAGEYPVRPIRLIVPAPPGGSTDLLGRVIGTRLGEALGQQVVIDNRGGAGGIVGTDMLTKAPPDGHTLAVIYTPHTVLPHMQKQLPYDPLAAIAPISMVTTAPLVLVVNPALPVHNVKELIALARKQPLVYGSAGNGSGGHLSGELLKQMTGIQATHVPYKGAGPAAMDVVSGQLQFQFAAQITAQGFMKSGRLRAIAVTSAQRAPGLPDMPTVAESGVPGFVVVNWFGMIAPARTPHAIVSRLNAEIVRALQQPDVRAKLTGEGSEIVGDTPAQFAAFLRADFEKWGKVIRASGLKVD